MTPSVQVHPRASRSEMRVVDAARRLFLDQGWAEVSMDDIAAEAGVARQTLYNRFGSKQAVLEAAIDAHWSALAQASVKGLDPSRDPQAVLADIASEILGFIDNHDQIAMTRAVVAESRHQPELARAFFEHGKMPLLQRFVDYLDTATRQGTLSCADPALAASQFLGMIQESLLWPRVMGTGRQLPGRRRVVDGAIAVFLRAYAPSSRGAAT